MSDISLDNRITLPQKLASLIANCQTQCMELFMSLVMIAWSVVMMLPVQYQDPCAIKFNEITNIIPAWFLLIFGIVKFGCVILDAIPLRRFTAFWSMLFWLFVTGLYWHNGFIFPDLAVFPLYAITCLISYLKMGNLVRFDKFLKAEANERSKHNNG